jgi:hypothetical protein
VKIRTFVHKGLKKLFLDDSAKGLPHDAVDKLRAILTLLQDIQDNGKSCGPFHYGRLAGSPGIERVFGACMSRATGA